MIFKDLVNTRQDTDCSVVFLFKGSFFLKTVVISASFKLSGKRSVIKHSLKRFCKVSGEFLQFTFNVLDGIVRIVFLVVALLRTML